MLTFSRVRAREETGGVVLPPLSFVQRIGLNRCKNISIFQKKGGDSYSDKEAVNQTVNEFRPEP